MAFIAALFYGFPSRRMKVIGVIGTKGKTTTCNLIAQILNFSGHKTGMVTTVNFRIGDKEWKNESKQTMLGRFQLQKLLRQMVKEKCEYAIVETSSEGILQYRHRFIDYDVAVFTNLSPEHIERHGGFENYRSAKVKLFEKVALPPHHKFWWGGEKKDSIGIYNLDDENVEYFLKPGIKTKYGFMLDQNKALPYREVPEIKNNFKKILAIKNIKLSPNKTEFEIDNFKFKMPLIGEFNIYNAAAAICAALSQNIPIEQIQKSLLSFQPVAGRMEVVDAGQNFSVIIDYAHEPKSLESVYKAVIETGLKMKNKKLICLLGAAGGGRDKWKRPEMGRISAQYCDEIILTNEDPYDENPLQIINDIGNGIRVNPRSHPRKSASVYKIVDRREAIKKAISLAKKGDAAVLTGKGGEVWMCVEGEKKISWDEKEIVEKILK
jgi:UDP-N-acetylmuramoyl-L-alanyl-D-glutamate--2,6-diaminopimelate ligase